ncbi:hypothetical protein K9M42_03125 [Patescibacteria group bacterium]|nr:hypothetical protein [Patescibacteria group bacterium]
MKKLKNFKLFEYRASEILKDEENSKFLYKVKDENPNLYSRFLSIVGNKGINIAKQKYSQYDPEEIKIRNRKIKKEEKRRIKEDSQKKFLEKYSGIIKKLNDELQTSPLKRILQFIKTEPKLKHWKKKYKKILNINNKFKFEIDIKFGTISLDQVELFPPTMFKDFEEFGSESLTIKRKAVLKNNEFFEFKYSVMFNFEYDYFNDNKFEIDKFEKISKLNTYNLTFDDLKEILEKFKYYMSQKYYKDWKIEQEINKYNL